MKRRNFIRAATLSGSPSVLLSLANAQAPWPGAPFHFVVPLPPGGSFDYLARLVGDKLSQTFNQPFVVENKVGAGGLVAMDYTSRQAPDGYTLAITPDLIVAHKSLFKNVRYDPLTDFMPVGVLVRLPFVLVVGGNSDVKSAREFLAKAKSASKPLTFGSSGVGSTYHLLGEYFSKTAKVELSHIPYRGTAQLQQALITGDIDCAFAPAGPFLQQISSGQMRALGVCGSAPAKILPGVGTLSSQLNLPDFNINPWIGIVAPKGTPPAIVKKLSEAISKIVNDPDFVKTRLESQGYEAVGSTPEAMAELMRKESVFYTDLIKRANISLE